MALLYDNSSVTCRAKIFRAVQRVPFKDYQAWLAHHKEFKFPRFRCPNDPRPVYWQLSLKPTSIAEFAGDSYFGFETAIGTFTTDRPEDDASVDPAAHSPRYVLDVRVRTGDNDTTFEDGPESTKQSFRLAVNSFNTLKSVFDKTTRKSFDHPCPYDERESMEIRCCIVYAEYVMEPALIVSPTPVLEEPLSADYLALFESGQNADYCFIAGGERIPAHKAILSARSEFFREMHRVTDGARDGDPSPDELVMPDIRPNTLKEMLRFIYGGKLRDDLTAEEAKELLPFADKYLLDTLKDLCAGIVAKGISNDDVFQMLAMADLHDCALLKQYCLRHIRDYFEELPIGEELSDVLHPALLAETRRFVAK